MKESLLLHGSPTSGLRVIEPGHRSDSYHPNVVFATSEHAVAAMFTISTRPVPQFFVDARNKIVYVENPIDLKVQRSGSIYKVKAAFRPTRNSWMHESTARRAEVVDEQVIRGALAHMLNNGYTVYGERAYVWVEQIVSYGAKPFPGRVPGKFRPLS